MTVSTAMTAQVATTAAVKPNTPSFEDYAIKAKEYGAAEGAGADSQIRFLMDLVEGAYHGVFNLKKDSRGAGRDDAAAMSEMYFTARNKNTVFNLKAGSIRKLCSTHRRGIQFGLTPKWGKMQPLQMSNEFFEQWKQFRKELDPKTSKHPSNGLKLNDAFNAFQLFITAQMKSNSILTKAERAELMFKDAVEPKTEVEKLEAARKMLDKSGDKSAQIEAAKHSIGVRLANIAKGIK